MTKALEEIAAEGADPFKLAHDAFDRMRRAHRRGTGCHLTAEMIRTLSVTFLGQVWEEDRPAILQSQEPQP